MNLLHVPRNADSSPDLGRERDVRATRKKERGKGKKKERGKGKRKKERGKRKEDKERGKRKEERGNGKRKRKRVSVVECRSSNAGRKMPVVECLKTWLH